jgi:ssDNA-binding Zn-finger/Zn-ribbon topoisomerase 1
MKISDVVYKTYDEVKEMPRFDMKMMPKKPKWYLQIVAWFLSFPETFAVKSNIIKHDMDKVQGPHIMLCNHNSFVDFKVATRAIFPKRSTYIVAVDGFINRENLMRNVGCFPKRKFVSDIAIIKQIRESIETHKVICQIYPEARYSLVGKTSPLPDSLGKLIKHTGYPVATLISHGHHLRSPFWNLKPRKVKTKTDLSLILTEQDIKVLSVEEINQKINKAFQYDDYKYQVEHNVEIKEPFRAEGLHKPLYMCPHCKKEHVMDSKGHTLFCTSCNETYEMDVLGRLHNQNGNSIFTHIPDWFEWQRKMVRKEIEQNQYNVKMDVVIESLPNSDGFYRLGDGELTHNENGFYLKGDGFEITKPVPANFGVHIEYDYFTKGDCISFSTLNDTFYIYPKDQSYSVTKFHFATEELFKYYNNLK